MRRKFLCAAAIMLCIAMLFSSCAFGADDETVTAPSENYTKKTVKESEDGIDISASYPETGASNVNAIIASEVRKNIDSFKKEADDYLSANVAICALNIDCEISPNGENILNVCYNIKSSIGSTVKESRFARAYNIAEDGLYRINDFFAPDDEAFLQTLNRCVRESLTAAGALGETPDAEALNSGAASDGFFGSFMFMQDKFVFVFPAGQLAEQSVTAEVPLSSFDGKVKPGSPSIKDYSQLETAESIHADAPTVEETTAEETTAEETTEKETTEEETAAPVNDGSKKIALTFDDGPGPYTDSILEALKQVGGKATFFMVGTSVNAYPEQVKHVYEAGCQIGNHTYDHPTLTKCSDDKIKKEVGQVQDLVEKLTGERPKLFRPPGGSKNEHIRGLVNMPFILWNVDTQDWKYRDSDYVYNYVMKTVGKGDIILMHDIHKTSAQAAVRLIKELSAQGYELVTISELFEAYGPPLVKGESFYAVTGNTWK